MILFPDEIEFLWKKPQYWGPGTDLQTAGPSVSNLDERSRTHDYAYAAAGKGRKGRVRRTQADLDMVSVGGVTGAWMLGQSMFRIFTFHQVPLPWD